MTLCKTFTMRSWASIVVLLVASATVFAHPYGSVQFSSVREISDIDNVELDVSRKISYSGSQLMKVVVDNDARRAVIVQLKHDKELSTWGGNTSSIDVLVAPDYVNHVKRVFQESAMPYEIVINDLQKAIDTENPPLDEEYEELANRKGHRMTWNAYHRMNDIHDFLDYLATTYPKIVSVQTIGHSVQKRPIKLIKISNGKIGNKAIWMDGGIHAREWISSAAVTYMINQFVENYDSETADVQNVDWYIVPLLNPDGYEYSHTTDRLWRKNMAKYGRCRGADLNRNFGYKWGGYGTTNNPCDEVYRGPSAFSEPESQAVQSFLRNNPANFEVYLSFHSYGQYILYPWGYDTVYPTDNSDLQRVGQKAAQAAFQIQSHKYTVGPSGATLYPASGGSDDWAKAVANIKYAYTIELPDTGRYGFILPASYIVPTSKEALALVRVMAATARAAA